jgi:hypothetical protein
MYDALYELSSLSLLLQERGTSIACADKLIRRSIRAMNMMAEKSGRQTQEA